MHPAANPFSTRFIRPGAIPYWFANGQSTADLIQALAASGWRGQIIGPHGSGKSTLLASLAPGLTAAGRHAWVCGLHNGQRHLPAGWIADAERARASLIVIDGFEQLSFWSRIKLSRSCRRRGWGVLVTAHADAGFTTLIDTTPSMQMAQAVVQRLLACSERTLGRATVSAAFAASDGNIREMLFALYDVIERQESQCGSA